MIRKGKYSINEVMSKRVDIKTPREESKAEFDGDLIKMNSHRYACFDKSGIQCVFCGIKGSFFAKEKSVEECKSYHFNLYAVDENGKEMLMTKDHIIPKSKGGKHHPDNYQTLCRVCNETKADKMEGEFEHATVV